MATTGAVLYFKPRAAAASVPGRKTGASIIFPVRFLSGMFSTVGVVPAKDLSQLRSILPNANVLPLRPGGTWNPQWYKFFQRFFDVFIGGAGTYTFSDLISAINSANSSAAEQSAITLAIAQQSQTNAEALSAAVQVISNNSLTGAAQIPPVKLSYSTQEP